MIDHDSFLSGVLVALGCAYHAGHETLAEEIVQTCGAEDLLRVAKREADIYLPELRCTVAFLKRRVPPMGAG